MSAAEPKLCKPEVEARIREELPNIDFDAIRDAPNLAMALNYLSHKVNPDGPRSSKEAAEFKQARDLRRGFSRIFAMVIEFKIVPRGVFKEMFKSNAKQAIAHDLVNSVALLQQYEPQLPGRTLAEPAMLDAAQKLGAEWLMRSNIGSPLVERPPEEKDAQIHARDVLYTRLVEVHDLMRKAAFWVWGSELNKYVPPLRSASRPKKTEADPNARVATTTTALTLTPTQAPATDGSVVKPATNETPTPNSTRPAVPGMTDNPIPKLVA